MTACLFNEGVWSHKGFVSRRTAGNKDPDTHLPRIL